VRTRFGGVLQTDNQRPQCSSASRFTAGAAGFLNLSQSGERPDLYRDPRRFETIPSNPILQACWNTTAPCGCSKGLLAVDQAHGFDHKRAVRSAVCYRSYGYAPPVPTIRRGRGRIGRLS
jgi:hypothetical protein